jgi:hypothetical protein
MDATPQPIAPDLQTSLRHLRRIVLGAAALLLLAGGASLATPAHAAGGKTGDVIVTGIVATEPTADTALTRKVNEYEGQHRVAADGPPPLVLAQIGDDPKDPKIPTG